MNQMRLVILGASGMVGGYALRYMLDHPTIERVTAIGRRKLGVSHPKLDEVFFSSPGLEKERRGRQAHPVAIADNLNNVISPVIIGHFCYFSQAF